MIKRGGNEHDENGTNRRRVRVYFSHNVLALGAEVGGGGLGTGAGERTTLSKASEAGPSAMFASDRGKIQREEEDNGGVVRQGDAGKRTNSGLFRREDGVAITRLDKFRDF